MGQKVNPTGFRLSVRKVWNSKWFEERKFSEWVVEDFRIRKFLENKCKGASKFCIERTHHMIRIVIHTAKVGLVVGKKGADVDVLKNDLRAMIARSRDVRVDTINSDMIKIDVEEIRSPAADAKCVADNIANQLKRRLPFRRVLKKAIQETMSHREAHGIKVQVSGRIGGAEIARTEWYKEGKIPLHTLRANIDYSEGRAETTYGSMGIKVWIFKGYDVELPKQTAVGG